MMSQLFGSLGSAEGQKTENGMPDIRGMMKMFD